MPGSYIATVFFDTRYVKKNRSSICPYDIPLIAQSMWSLRIRKRYVEAHIKRNYSADFPHAGGVMRPQIFNFSYLKINGHKTMRSNEQ